MQQSFPRLPLFPGMHSLRRFHHIRSSSRCVIPSVGGFSPSPSVRRSPSVDISSLRLFGSEAVEDAAGSSSVGGNEQTSRPFLPSSYYLRKAPKARVSWVCEDCGNSHGQWWGICPSCKKAGTFRQFSEVSNSSSPNDRKGGFEVAEGVARSWLRSGPADSVPLSLTEVNKRINIADWRIPLSGIFGMEVSRVLGGGVVPGSLILIGGDPGVGKSTFLLQIAAMLAEGSDSSGPAPVVYVSGEESIEQIGSRADRMKIGTTHLYLYSSTDLEDILEKIQPLSPRALIVDSIQTVYLSCVAGSAGSIAQGFKKFQYDIRQADEVRECTSALLRFAKQTNVPVFLIGHVTKAGDIAGPRILEHIVDAVLYMEGERYMSHRLLRSVKNRFGSNDELGVFQMSQCGLQTVSNPSQMFLAENDCSSEILVGLAVSVTIDSSRVFLLEVQALCISDVPVARHVNGVKESRTDMIISVLVKQVGLKLQGVVFVNVLSGMELKDTGGDLAIAVSICSSFLEFPIPKSVAFIGEVGLGGELRTVPRMDKRVNELIKLGFEKCVVPKAAEKSFKDNDIKGITIVSCGNLKDVLDKVFTTR